MNTFLLACSFMGFYFIGKFLGYRKAEKHFKKQLAVEEEKTQKILDFFTQRTVEAKKDYQSDADA